jgi:hypothetical protein
MRFDGYNTDVDLYKGVINHGLLKITEETKEIKNTKVRTFQYLSRRLNNEFCSFEGLFMLKI